MMKKAKKCITSLLLSVIQLMSVSVPGAMTVHAASQVTRYGDTDCSGVVDIADAVLLARVIAEDKDVVISAQGLKNADADLSGKVNQADVTRVLQFIAKLVDPPAPKEPETTATTTASTTQLTTTTAAKTTATTAKATTTTAKATTVTAKATTTTAKATTTTAKATTTTAKATTVTAKATTTTAKKTTTTATHTTTVTTKKTTAATTTTTTAATTIPANLDIKVKQVKDYKTLSASKDPLEQKLAKRLAEESENFTRNDGEFAPLANYSILYSYQADEKGNRYDDGHENFIMLYDASAFEKDEKTGLSKLIDKKNKGGVSWADKYVEFLTMLRRISGGSRDGYLVVFSDVGDTAYSLGSFIALPRDFMNDLATAIYISANCDHWAVNWAMLHESSHSYKFVSNTFNFSEEFTTNIRFITALHKMGNLDAEQYIITETTDKNEIQYHSPYDLEDYKLISTHQYVTREGNNAMASFKNKKDLSDYSDDFGGMAFFFESAFFSYMTPNPLWNYDYKDYANVEKNFKLSDECWDRILAMLITQPDTLDRPVSENAVKIYKEYQQYLKEQSTAELNYYFYAAARSNSDLTNTIIDRRYVPQVVFDYLKPDINTKSDYANGLIQGMMYLDYDEDSLQLANIFDLITNHKKDSARTKQVEAINSIKNTAGFNIRQVYSAVIRVPRQSTYKDYQTTRDTIVDIILTGEDKATTLQAYGIYTLSQFDRETEKEKFTGTLNWIIKNGDKKETLDAAKNCFVYENAKFKAGEYDVLNDLVLPSGVTESKKRHKVYCFKTPTAYSVQKGSNVTVSTTAFDGDFVYSWFKYDEKTKKWEKVEGASKPTFTVQAAASASTGSVMKYRCTVQYNGKTDDGAKNSAVYTSDEITVTVK